MIKAQTIDRASDIPLFVQIRDHLRAEITNGGFSANLQLPPFKVLTRRYHASLGTIQRVIRDLASEGLVKGVRGSGIYVTWKPEAAGQSTELWVSPIVRTFTRSEVTELLNEFHGVLPGARVRFREERPNVIEMRSDDIPFLANDLSDLTDLIRETFARPAGEPDMFAPLQVDGRSVMLPTYQSVNTVFCNLDLLEAEGVSLPEPGWTWQDLLAIAQELTCPDAGRYGFYPFHLSGMYHAFVWQSGGRIFNSDGEHIYADGDASIEFAELLRKLGACAPPEAKSHAWNVGNGLPYFARGQVAMVIADVWDPEFLRRQKGKIRWTALPLPVGEIPACVLRAGGFGLRKNSRARELAENFLRLAGQWEKWPDKIGHHYGLFMHADLERHDEVESAYKKMITCARTPLSDIVPECRSPRHYDVLRLLMPALSRVLCTDEPVAEILRHSKDHIDALLSEDRQSPRMEGR